MKKNYTIEQIKKMIDGLKDDYSDNIFTTEFCKSIDWNKKNIEFITFSEIQIILCQKFHVATEAIWQILQNEFTEFILDISDMLNLDKYPYFKDLFDYYIKVDNSRIYGIKFSICNGYIKHFIQII